MRWKLRDVGKHENMGASKERAINLIFLSLHYIVLYFNILYYICLAKGGPRLLSQYSNSPRAGQSGDRIPVGGEIFRTRPDWPWGPPSLLYNGYRVSFPGVDLLGRGVNHPPSFCAEVEERVELYLYSPSGSSWPVLE